MNVSTLHDADGTKAVLYRPESSRRRRRSTVDDHAIVELAERQHGLVTLWQLEDLGVGEQVARKRMAAGRFHRIHQGVYAVGHPLLSREGHLLAAVLACGPDAVLSHRSAAALHGFLEDSRTRIDVIAPNRRGRAPAGIFAHRDGTLTTVDRAVIDGIPCTGVARTLLDVAAMESPRTLRHAVTQAEVERVFDLAALQELLKRSRGRRGVARLRLAIAHHDPREQDARRELEKRFLALCQKFGLPAPEVNGHLLIDGISLMPDFMWRDAALIVEADSRRVHGTVTAFEKDRLRDQRLAVAGWTVIRCTWAQVRDEPERLSRTLRSLLSRPSLGRRDENGPI